MRVVFPGGFETPAVGGLLRMSSFVAAKPQSLVVRSPHKAGVANHEAQSELEP